MGQILHRSATTTGFVRRAIQKSSDSLRALSKCYGVNPKTAPKWKKRTGARGLAHGSAHLALDGAQHRRRGGDRPRFAATERCRWTIFSTRFSRPSRIHLLTRYRAAMSQEAEPLGAVSLRAAPRHLAPARSRRRQPVKKRFKRYHIGYFHIRCPAGA
jgi:hypothetical protein